MAVVNDRKMGRRYGPARIAPSWMYAAALRHAYGHLLGTLPRRHHVVGVDGVEQVGCSLARPGDFRRVVVTLH